MDDTTLATVEKIIRSYDDGHLPDCEESIFQSDHWQIAAAQILGDICNALNLYEPVEDEDLD